MSNVIGFKVFKNTLKRDSGYAPVSGENGYSVIRCVFPSGGDWDNISAVSAGFFVHPKYIAGVTAAIATDGTERAAVFTIPGALLKQGERLHFGLFATVGGVTIATNTVALDVARGIISEDIDYDPEEAASMFEQFSNALNTALLGKANKAAAGSAGELAALDGNGSPIRSGVSVAQIVGDGSNSKVPTTEAVKEYFFDTIDAILNGSEDGAPSLFVRQNTQTGKYQLVYEDSNDNLHVLFDFGLLPAVKGEKGDKGDAGRGVTSFSLSNGVLTASFDDRTSQTIGNVKGEKGDKGDKGDTGAQGEKGDKGDTGAQGETGATGAQGDKGDKGDAGRGVTSFSLTNGVLSANFDDRTSQTIGNVKGEKGDKGDKGDTGAQGEKGEKGDKGDTGATGPQGPAGSNYVLTDADRQAIAQLAMDGLNGNGVAY